MAQELTFNITEDTRRLKRPTSVKDFQLSFGHADQGPTDVVIGDDGNIVQGRYGDSARQVFVNVVQGKNNEPVDITGYLPEFNGCIPDAEHIVIDNWDGVLVDPRHGRFRFDFPIQAFTVAGSYKQAYFRLVQNGTGKTLATLEFDMQVLEDFVYSNIVPQDYVTPYLDMINKLKDAYTNFVGKTQDSFDQAKKRLDDIMSTVEDKADTVEQRLKIDEQALTELSEKIDEKGLFTQAEADVFKQTIEDRLKNIGIIGLNVVGYGAKGDGQADDTEAIVKAFEDAKTNKSHHVYFPAGQYTVNTTIPVNGITVSGDDRNSSIIVNDRAEPVFSLQSNSGIHDLGFKTTVTSNNKMIAIEKNSNDVAYQDIDIHNVAFESPELGADGKPAKWGLRPLYFDLDNLGLTGVTARDILCRNVYGGLTVDTTNDGWMTGCLYDNITVRGFKHHVLELTSSNNTLNQLSQNVFSNFTGQVLHEANDDAAGYIVAGTGNNFDNLRLFNDGNSNWHAIKLHYCGGDKFDAHNPTFSKGATAFNSFKGGDLEGIIYDPDGLRELQHFDHVQLQIYGSAVGDDSVIQMVNINDPIHTNLLSRRGFIKNTAISAQAELPSDARIIQSADSYGEFFEITMGATGGTFDYILNDPEATVSAVKQGDYTIGLRWQNLNPNIDLSKNLRAYLEFGGQDVTDYYKYIYKNPNIHSDLKEWSWIVEPDQSFYAKSINYADNNFFKIYLGPNMHIKIYAIFVCPGRVLDFERVNDDGELNVLPLTTAKPLPVGTTLTGISHHMVRYAGTYYAGAGNHPADTPADFSNNDYMIRVTPGTANDNGILELIDLNTNTFLTSTVAGGNSFTWIKQHT